MKELEKIRAKKREDVRLAYENMEKALKGSGGLQGVNAVLKFLNVNGSVDDSLPIGVQLERIAEHYNINVRYGKLEKDFYIKAVLPMLVKTKEDTYLAVIPRQNGSCYYIKGNKKINLSEEKRALFTDEALYFYKNLGSDKVSLKRLVRFMLDCVSRTDKLTVLLLSLMASGSGLLLPWANHYIFSKIIPTGASSGTLATAALMLSAIMTATLVKLIQSFAMANSMARVSAYVQNSVIHRLLRLQSGFFKSEKSGALSDLIMRFSDILQIISANSITAFLSAALSVVYLYQIYHYAPSLLGVTLFTTAAFLIVMIREGVSGIRYKKTYTKTLSDMSGFAYEMFSGMEQVKLNGAETKMLHRWSQRYVACAGAETPPFVIQYAGVIYKLITTLAMLFKFWGAAEIPASRYIAFSTSYGSYIAALMSLAGVITTIGELKASYEMVRPLFDAELEETATNRQRPAEISGEITVSGLSFRYHDTMPYIIKDMSFTVKKGESIGIVGASGCGKSTLIRLLLGFETPEDGSIYIDGFDLRELDLKYYRQNIGTVMQNAKLVSGDIYSNITLTKPNAQIDEVWEAVSLAGLYDDINALPMGLHTPVSEENCTLSGGQRQRILIARVVISKPSILIFDEATSALDNITQAKITEGINQLDCTKLIVAHRYTTIKACDRILVLDQGRIAECGTYQELIDKKGIFFGLMSGQKLQS